MAIFSTENTVARSFLRKWCGDLPGGKSPPPPPPHRGPRCPSVLCCGVHGKALCVLLSKPQHRDSKTAAIFPDAPKGVQVHMGMHSAEMMLFGCTRSSNSYGKGPRQPQICFNLLQHLAGFYRPMGTFWTSVTIWRSNEKTCCSLCDVLLQMMGYAKYSRPHAQGSSVARLPGRSLER